MSGNGRDGGERRLRDESEGAEDRRRKGKRQRREQQDE